MSELLSDKICIVTGAGRGIGACIARTFAENGAIVYANVRQEAAFDRQFSKTGNVDGGRIRPLVFDVTDEESMRRAVLQVKREHGRIDGLVNNAAVEFNELIGMISRENMEKMFSVNVYGTIDMLQLVSRIMTRQEGGGSIVNIASLVGLRGNRGQLVYSATKGAVVALTRSAAKELADRGVRVNAIAPGLTDTEMMRQADPEKLKNRIGNICMGRLASPRDIANACMFLVSDLSEYVSGQVLAVDGCTIM